MKKILGAFALLVWGAAGAQSFNVFQPGGALSGSWNSQDVNLGAGSPYIFGLLPPGDLASGNLPLGVESNAGNPIVDTQSAQSLLNKNVSYLNNILVDNPTEVRAIQDGSNQNLTLSGLQAVDFEASPFDGQRVLLWLQSTTPSQNGCWIEHTGPWTRCPDYSSGNTQQAYYGITYKALLGVAWQGQTFYLTTSGTITIDTTATTWAAVFLALNNANSSFAPGTVPVTGIASGLVVAGSGISVSSASGVYTVASSGAISSISSGPGLCGGTITSTGTLQTCQPPNSQTSTSYTIQCSDAGKLIDFANSSAIAISLPQLGTSCFSYPFQFRVQNNGVGTATFTPSSPNTLSSGNPTLPIASNLGCDIQADSGNTQWDLSACSAITGTAVPTPVPPNSGYPYLAANWGVPVILPSSGSIGNNGALTLTTALPTTFANSCMYFPVNTIASGVAAGVYYVKMSSTTAGTIYNNACGTPPAIISSPTAFSTTGPGAYTQTINTSEMLVTAPIAGGTMGNDGSLVIDTPISTITNSDSKYFVYYLGGTQIAENIPTTNDWAGVFHRTVRNMASSSTQVMFPANVSASTDSAGNTSTQPTFTNVNTATSQNLTISGELTTATDYVIIYGGTVVTNYAP